MPPKKPTAEIPSEFHWLGDGFAPGSPRQPPFKKGIPGIWTVGQYGFSFRFEPVQIVTDNLVRLDNGPAKEVIDEIKKFWGLKDRFKSFGYLHKRGFLLHGPPGTGKTTTLNLIMEDMVKAGGMVVTVSDARMVGPLIDMLKGFRAVDAHTPLLVVMEDIDNLVGVVETQILALLDGEYQIENVVYVATTNYLRRLPERIHNRPSRFDKKIEIGPPSVEARREYLRSRGITGPELEDYVKHSKGISIAHLKELIISVAILGNDLKGTAERLGGDLEGEG